VGGNAWGLAQGENALGLESSVLVLAHKWWNYPNDINLNLQDISSNLRRVTKLLSTFLSIRKKYDVFHFNYGRSLLSFPHTFMSHLPYLCKYLNHIDLPFYPAKSKLFVTYNGCDARQKYPTIERTEIAACHEQTCKSGLCNSGKLDEYKQKSIEKMGRYVKHMWALNPDLLYFLPKEKSSFLPYSISWDGLEPHPPKLEKKMKIVHAPTNRETKGSHYILEALQKIRKTHADVIDVRLVENIPHEQALKIYRDADLVIDQILIGWYGGFAVEAMKMGKPVISRIAREDLHFVPNKMADDVLETIINAEPHNIYEVLLTCIEDRSFLKRCSEASQEYVHTWHDPKYVANITKEKYEAEQ
jgi:glycosyltransferase involved in cell wall biosynthesis